jgi:hypothetical protein
MSTDNSSANPFGPQGPSDANNPFRDNPYQTPNAAGMGANLGVPLSPGRGLIGHVLVVAILMIVQGVLEAVMGLFLFGMAFVVPMLMQTELQRSGGPTGGPSPAQFQWIQWIMGSVYGGLGLLLLVVATLRIVAGLGNMKYRRRVLGMGAMLGGMATVFSCYCAPTAIALAIYGLIVYFNPQVTLAFAMGQSGIQKDVIEATFR